MPTRRKGKPEEPAEEEDTLEDLLVLQLREMYDVATEIKKMLPKIMKKIAHPELQDRCEAQRAAAEDRARQLEGIFLKMEITPQKFPSAAVRGLAEDAEWTGKNLSGASVRDAGLAATLRLVQHYELVLYVEASSWAERLEFGVAD